jgi:hypothetical protein
MFSQMFKRLSALALFSAAAVYGQAATVTPDCVVTFNFTAAAQATPNLSCGHNNTVGIYDWHVLYFSTGFSALSLVVESAPDAGGVPGTWVTFAGTLDSGVNPNTAITQADTRLHGYFPWNRVRLASVTGTGIIQGVFYGCRQPGCSNAQIAGMISSVNLAQIGGFAVVMGGVNGSLGVGGLAANAAPVAGRPVLVAGSDGVDARTLTTFTDGRLEPAFVSTTLNDTQPNASYFPGSNSGNALRSVSYNFGFDGAFWERQLVCPSSATFNITTSGDHQVIAASGTTRIYICDVSFSADAPSDFKLDTGTGADCVAGTAAITGLYKQTVTFEVPFAGQLRGTAGQALCVNFGTSVNVGGTITYVQF